MLIRPTALFAFVFVVTAGFVHFACGPGTKPAVCGNGVVEVGEQCDLGAHNGQDGYACDSTCHSISVPRSSVRVRWTILGNTGVDGFDAANCDSFDSKATAHIFLTAPKSTVNLSADVPCLSGQYTFTKACGDDAGADCMTRLPPGQYQATVTLNRADGSSFTQAVSSSQQQVAYGKETDLTIDFQTTDLLSPPPGSLLFDLSWGKDGQTCTGVTPNVTSESLVLHLPSINTPVMAMTLLGTTLDGKPGKCFVPDPNMLNSVEEVPNLPIGYYQMDVKGFTGGATAAYASSFCVFVGPGGRNNPTFKLTVPAAGAIPDGGGNPDAGTPPMVCPKSM